jgi:hypothetical protein
MNNNLLELHLLEQMKIQLRMRKLESDLIEQFDFAFNWVMDTAEKNQIELPNEDGIYSCLQRIESLMNEIYGKSPETDHGFGNTRRSNRTIILIEKAGFLQIMYGMQLP